MVMQQLPLAMRLRERAVFESFVPGPNVQTVESLARLAEGTSSDVAWLCGPAGVGKSHLLQALCARAQQFGLAAAYLPMRQLHALGVETLSGWQRMRVLALDDLDAVAGERDWDRALFGLLRETLERGTTLVASAEEPPRQLRFGLADLVSRLAAAALLPLRALDEGQQREALRLRAQARGLELPEETALYLQRHYPRDLPSLYQLLDTLDEAALTAQRRVTVPFIRSVLESR